MDNKFTKTVQFTSFVDPFDEFSTNFIQQHNTSSIITVKHISRQAFMNISLGQLTSYSFVLNRNISVTGAALTPSSLGANFIVEIEFGPNYDLSSAIPSSGIYSSYTIHPSTNIVALSYTLSPSPAQILMTISNVTNPLATNIYQYISLKIKNASSQTVIDQGDLSLIYVSSLFSKISQWNETFTPGNVTTLNTFQFTFMPDIWKNGKMSLTLAFGKYYTRSLQNITTTTIISSSTKCQPTCTVSSKSTFTEVQFSGLSLNTSTGSIHIKILNILSPPTTEKVDIVSVSTYETSFMSTVETGQMMTWSTKPNELQSLIATTTSKINEPITLQLDLMTSNIFGPNDTLNIVLNQDLLTAGVNATLSNGIVAGQNIDIISRRQLLFSQFTILSSTYSKMTFSIILNSSITPVRSTQPIISNKISIKRNGYLYNYQEFDFAVLPIVNESSVNLQLSNNFANFNSTLSISIPKVMENIVNGDVIKIEIPKNIKVFQNTCNPIQCTGCLCLMDLANDSSALSTITVYNFPTLNALTSFSLNLQIKNPLISNYSLNICHYDSRNFTIECFSGVFPAVKQSTLGSKTIDFSSSNDTVYSVANYTIKVNLTQYSLSQGYMLLYLQKGMYLVNTSVVVCYVNDEPGCDFKSNSTSDQIVVKVNVIDTNVKLYTVKLENMRNPISTQPFQFWLKVYSSVLNSNSSSTSQQVLYYQAQSTYYSVSKAYKLTNVQSNLSNCQNNMLSNLSITFPQNSLPFVPPNGILIDNPQPAQSSYLTLQLNQQMIWNPTQIKISLQNFVTLQPIRYSLLLKTMDMLYDIFVFDIIIKNCEAAVLGISSWKMTGLLGDAGQLFFTLSNSQNFDDMLLEFPLEYSLNPSSLYIQSNSLKTQKTSLNTFKFTGSLVSYSIWNFTNPTQKSSYFKLSTFKISSNDNKSYLMAQNINLIFYDLSTITTCRFPCKLCSSANSQICLECYPSLYTQKYLLTNGTCTSLCPNGFYLSSTTKTCHRCNLSCLTCDQTKCLTCVQYYYYLNGSCLTDCPDKYFPISLNQTCALCSYPCDKCVNSTTCINCLGAFYWTGEGKCVTNCQVTEYPISNVCRKCQAPCETCSQQLNNCTKCLEGYYFNYGSCVTVCPSPLIGLKVNNNPICTTCTSPCLTCTTSPTSCTSCLQTFTLFQFECINQCPSGYFQSSLVNICLTCPQQCALCTNQNTCSICAKGYKLYSSTKCLAYCPLGYFAQNISNQLSGNATQNVSQVCMECSNDGRCIKCENQSSCSICSNGFYFMNGTCLNTCPISTFVEVNSCKNCPSSCLYCLSETICQVCSSTSLLYSEKCITSCPNFTISYQITVNVTPNNSIMTKSCVACDQVYPNCQDCTNLTCTQCKSNFVMDFDYKCKIACSQNYIVINNNSTQNKGNFCQKCESQCQSCTNSLNNCTLCNQQYTLNLKTLRNNQTLRQCLSQCPYPSIKYLNQCTACSYPCHTCIQLPQKCLSCSNSSQLYLMNSTCISECPQRSYGFQSTCVPCDISCSICNKDGCLKCAQGYYIGEEYQMTNKTLYYCYAQCPVTLPFVNQHNACTKCAQHCLSCNTAKCLQCQASYYIFGLYCVPQCPLPLVNYSRSCVNSSDIPVEPLTPVQPVTPVIPETPVIVQQSYFSMPVPFTVALSVIFVMSLLSKCQNPQTHLSVSSYALGTILCIACIVYYFVMFIIDGSWISLSSTILLVAIIINYILNIIFLILSKFTLYSDEQFYKATYAHRQYSVLMFLLTLFFSHSVYILFFSRLFDFSMFKLYLKSVNCLKVLNYLWGMQVIIYMLGIASGIARILTVSRANYTLSQTFYHFYQCMDLIVVNFVLFLLSILNFKKPKSIYLKQQDFISTQSTKKVIFDESSDKNIADHEFDQSREQWNIRGQNFKIANQEMFDNILFPEESGHKFSISEKSNIQNQNYDDAFMDEFVFMKKEEAKEKNSMAETKDRFMTPEKQEYPKENKNNHPAESFSLSKTIDLKLNENQILEHLEVMRQVNIISQVIPNSPQIQIETQLISQEGILSNKEQSSQSEHQVIFNHQPLEQQQLSIHNTTQNIIENQQKQIDLSKVIEEPQQEEQPSKIPEFNVREESSDAINSPKANELSYEHEFLNQNINKVGIICNDKQILQENSNQRESSIQKTRIQLTIKPNEKIDDVPIAENQQKEQLVDNYIQQAQLSQSKQSISLRNNLSAGQLMTKSQKISLNSQSLKRLTNLRKSPVQSPRLSEKINKKNNSCNSVHHLEKKSPQKNIFKSNSLSKTQTKEQIIKQQIKDTQQNQKSQNKKKSLHQHKEKRKRYKQSPQKQIFIPGYLFASKYHQPKLHQPSRISGVNSLFGSISVSNPNEKSAQNQLNILENNLSHESSLFKDEMQHNQVKVSFQNLAEEIHEDSSQLHQYETNQIFEGQNPTHLQMSEVSDPQINSMVLEDNGKLPPSQLLQLSQALSIQKKGQINKQKNKSKIAIDSQTQKNVKQTQRKHEQLDFDTKFYFQDEKLYQKKSNQQIKTSKSFSPRGVQKSSSKRVQRKGYQKKQPQQLENNRKNDQTNLISNNKINHAKKTQSEQKNNSLEPQFDVIDYVKPKKVQKSQKIRKQVKKQQVSHLLSQIQRKDKIHSKERQLEGIYGKKNQ